MKETASGEEKKKRIPPIGKIIELYEGRYSKRTIKVVYSDIKNRIKDLTDVVEDNGSSPLISKEDWGRNDDIGPEMEKRAITNQSTKDTLEDYELALKRLIEGTLGECVKCHKIINSDRLMAIPSASTCAKCKSEGPPIRVLR